MRMRVERLQMVMEGEYACHIRGIMKYSDQRGCMNIIRIYESRIGELLGFYIFRDMGNEINLLPFSPYFIWWYLSHLYTYQNQY